MQRTLVPLLAIAVLPWSEPAQSANAPTEPLKASTPWTADFSDSQCTLQRKFGKDGGNTTVELSRAGPLSSFSLTIVSLVDSGAAARGKVQMELDGSKAWTTAQAIPIGQDGASSILTFDSWEGPFLKELNERFAHEESLSLRIRLPNRDIMFDFDNVKAAKAALDKCEDTLMAEIGLDGPSLRSMRSPAVPIDTKRYWITNADYPTRLLRAGSGGVVRVRWIIDENGSMGSCGLIDKSGDAALANYVCGLMMSRNIRYKPALSAAGTPMKSYNERRMVFSR